MKNLSSLYLYKKIHTNFDIYYISGITGKLPFNILWATPRRGLWDASWVQYFNFEPLNLSISTCFANMIMYLPISFQGNFDAKEAYEAHRFMDMESIFAI